MPIIPINTAASIWSSDEGKRTVAGAVDNIVREPIELSRMFKDQYYFSRRDPQRIKDEAATEAFLKDISSKIVGEQNVGETQRGFYETGEPKMVTTIKRPEGTVANIVRDGVAFATDFIGLGKITKPLRAPELFTKLKQTAPIKGKIADKTTKGAEALFRAEATTQLTIDPYRDNFANFIGDYIEDDNEGWLGDIETFILEPLESRQEYTQAENRMRLLAEGMIIYAGIGATGAAITSDTVASSISRNKERFIDALKLLRNSSADTKEKFLNKLSSRRKQQDIVPPEVRVSADLIESAQAKDPKARVPDIQALDNQGTISRIFTDLNLQFNKNPLVRTLESLRLRTFTSRGNMTPEMHERFLKTENTKAAWSTTIDFVAQDLTYSLDKIAKLTSKNKISNFKSKDELLNQVNLVLFKDFRLPTTITDSKITPTRKVVRARYQGPTFEKELKKLPRELHVPIRQARKLQTDISKLFLKSTAIDKSFKESIVKELDTYFKKAYEFYDNPNYKPKISDKLAKDLIEVETVEIIRKARAKEKLDRQKGKNVVPKTEQVARAEAEGTVRELIEKQKSGGLKGQQDTLDYLNSKEFASRIYLSPEYSKLMKEITDPVSRIINSTKKSVDYVLNKEFYKEEAERGLNVIFYKEKTGIFTKEIPSGFGELSGLYTTPQLRSYLTTNADDFLEGKYIGAILRPLLQYKYAAQKTATVYSGITNIKNGVGMMQGSLQAGVNPLNPDRAKTVLAALETQFVKVSPKEQQEFFTKLTNYGLIGKSTIIGDLRGLAKDLKNNALIDKVPGLNRLDQTATKFYQSVDDFGKINMWLDEIENLKQFNAALPKGAKFNRFRIANIEEEAARLTRMHLPNYDMIPRNIQKIRKIPFIGAFYSFTAEALRNTLNNLGTIIRDTSRVASLRSAGATEAANILQKRLTKRVVGFTAMIGAEEATRQTFNSLYNISDAEIEAIKVISPDYYNNVIVSRNENNSPVVFNYGTWDYANFPKLQYEFLADIPENITEQQVEGALKDYITRWADKTFSSFVGPSITQNTINQFFANGENEFGGVMYNPLDPTDRYRQSNSMLERITDSNNIKIFILNLAKALVPPEARRTVEYFQTKDFNRNDFDQDVDPLTRLLIGGTYQTLNKEYLETKYKIEVSKFIDIKKQAEREQFEGVRQKSNNQIFAKNYYDANRAFAKKYAKFAKLTNAMQILGVDTLEILEDSRLDAQDVDYLSNVNKSTIYFPSLGLSEKLNADGTDLSFKIDAGIARKIYENKFNNLDNLKLNKIILDMDAQFRTYPLLIQPESEEKYIEFPKFERTKKTTGGLIEGVIDVPYTKEEPEERINPFTGEPYTAIYNPTRVQLEEGGPVGGRDKLGKTQIPALTEKEFAYLLNVSKSDEVEPSERQSALKQITQGMDASVKGISKGLSSLFSTSQGLTEEQILYLQRLKKNEGGRVARKKEYKEKLQELEDFISKNRLVSKEAQMNQMMGEGYRDPRFIATTGNELIDKYGLHPLAPEGSGQVLYDKQLGLQVSSDKDASVIDTDTSLSAETLGTYSPSSDKLKYQSMNYDLGLTDTTPEEIQVHEIIHRADNRSGYKEQREKRLIAKLPKNLKVYGRKYFSPITEEILAHGLQHKLAGGNFSDEELTDQVKFRIGKYKRKFKNPKKIEEELLQAMPIIVEDFESYLKEIDAQ
jgi:hypothetical protein